MGGRKTETTNEFLSVKFDNCKKSAKELVYLNGKIRSPHDNLKQAASMYSFRSDFTIRTRLCSERFWCQFIISFKSREPAVNKTHTPENGHFDVLMTFSFLLTTYTKHSFHLRGKMCSSRKINRSVETP